MKKNKLPDNELDIITPILGSRLRLDRYYQEYPELYGINTAELKRKKEIDLYAITKRTPLAAREAVEILAYYFRREFQYDFPPYEAREGGDCRDRIFLLTQDDGWETKYAIGAIGFRWRKDRLAPEQLALVWVWIHPFLRRQGIFTACWNIFRKLYGDFSVESPLSPAMKSFLEKMKHQSSD